MRLDNRSPISSHLPILHMTKLLPTLGLHLLLLAATATVRAADTPAAILADYHAKAAAALAKINATLEKATVPLIAALVKAGDTAGAQMGSGCKFLTEFLPVSIGHLCQVFAH